MSRYSNTKIKRKSLLPKQKKNVLSYGTTLYQRIPETNGDLHVISTEGDRCDLLAQEYYGTTELWWYIASVNNLKSNNIEAGTQLRVPVSIEQAILK